MGNYIDHKSDGGWGSGYRVSFDSDRQMDSYGPRSHNELRPKSKFYNLLIYAGYPVAE